MNSHGGKRVTFCVDFRKVRCTITLRGSRFSLIGCVLELDSLVGLHCKYSPLVKLEEHLTVAHTTHKFPCGVQPSRSLSFQKS